MTIQERWKYPCGTDHVRSLLNWQLSRTIRGLKDRTIAGGDGGVAKTVAVPEQQERFGAESLRESERLSHLRTGAPLPSTMIGDALRSWAIA